MSNIIPNIYSDANGHTNVYMELNLRLSDVSTFPRVISMDQSSVVPRDNEVYTGVATIEPGEQLVHSYLLMPSAPICVSRCMKRRIQSVNDIPLRIDVGYAAG